MSSRKTPEPSPAKLLTPRLSLAVQYASAAQNLPTRLVAVSSNKISSVVLANRLRHHAVPIFTRIQDDKVLIDPRTLLDGDEKIILKALTEILGG